MLSDSFVIVYVPHESGKVAVKDVEARVEMGVGHGYESTCFTMQPIR